MTAMDVMINAWPVLAGAMALATLAFLRVLSMFAEKQIVRHNTIREARQMRANYMKKQADHMPTADWDVVE